jgi:hypothetical protein
VTATELITEPTTTGGVPATGFLTMSTTAPVASFISRTATKMPDSSRKCHICAKPLEYRRNGRGRGRPRVVHVECAPEAKRRAAAEWRASHLPKPLCAWCNAAPVPPGKGWSRYCSPECARLAANRRRHEARHNESAGDRNTLN